MNKNGRIDTNDIITAYWTQNLKPVFKNNTLIYGLLKSILTKGFSRAILMHNISVI